MFYRFLLLSVFVDIIIEMQWTWMRGWGWKYVILPSIMGIFFGFGSFIAYLFFSMEGFKKAEQKFNNILKELLWLIYLIYPQKTSLLLNKTISVSLSPGLDINRSDINESIEVLGWKIYRVEEEIVVLLQLELKESWVFLVLELETHH